MANKKNSPCHPKMIRTVHIIRYVFSFPYYESSEIMYRQASWAESKNISVVLTPLSS